MDAQLNVEKKKVRYLSHINFLQTCVNESLIPKGFRWKWKIGVDADRQLREKCDRIKTDASLKLMQLSIDACSEKLNAITNEYGSSGSVQQCPDLPHRQRIAEKIY